MPSRTSSRRRSREIRRWRAPGRVNIIGEHIDYLGGTVLPFACDLELAVSVRLREGPVSLVSDGGSPDAYVEGVVHALEEAGTQVFGCEGTIHSDIPIGAGLSSSAALAAGIALAVSDGVRPAPEVLRRSEQLASGVHGGLMDQTAILFGRRGHALLLDCATGAVEHVVIPREIGFVVIDTGTRRSLADGRYAQRRAEVEAGEVKRVRHAESEQRRVYDAVDALRAGDVASLGALVSDSHASLRDDFEVSSPSLDLAVEVARSHPRCHGARLVGAGFAGCVLAIAERDASDEVAAFVVGRLPDTRADVVVAVDGAGPAPIKRA